jgi:predicted  nucleic acid-binding Zn-ribbon protein
MKKTCALLLIGLSIVFVGCKKEPASSGSGTKQITPAATETQKSLQETATKAVEAAKPALPEVKQALVTKAAEIDMTSSVDKLKEQAKQMSVDALKATAEKYKTQLLSTQSDITSKMDLLSKIPMTEKLGAEAQALTKDITTLTNTMASLKDRMMVYVNALNAQGVDVSSFTL